MIAGKTEKKVSVSYEKGSRKVDVAVLSLVGTMEWNSDNCFKISE